MILTQAFEKGTREHYNFFLNFCSNLSYLYIFINSFFVVIVWGFFVLFSFCVCLFFSFEQTFLIEGVVDFAQATAEKFAVGASLLQVTLLFPW